MVALDFDRFLLDRSAGAASVFELRQKIPQMLTRMTFIEPSDNGDDFSSFAFLDRQPGR